MPIPVACRCGKSFAANDNLAGKTVKCPGCQQPLPIPAPGQPAAKGGAAPKAGVQPAGNGKVAAACKCGAKFAAPAELAGKQVKCPKCGQALTVGAAPPAAAPSQPKAATPQNAAAPIPVTCKCGARFGAKPELRGRTVKCPKCSQPLVVGASASALAAQTVPAPATPAAPAGGGFGLDDLFNEIGLQPKARGENACPSCSAELAPDAVLCVHCGFDRQKGKKIQVETIKKVEAKKLGPPSASAKGNKGAGGGGASSMPWEQAGGEFGAMFATAQAVIASPQEAFARLRADGLMASLGYYFATVMLLAFLLALLYGGAIAVLSGGELMGIAALVAGAIIAYMLIAGSLSLLLYGAIYHGLLKLVGGANRPISTSYQVLGYCTGAAHLIAVCPCLILLMPVIAFYSIPVGMASAHNTTLGKSYVALLLYIVLAFAFQFALSTALQIVLQSVMPDLPQNPGG